MKKYNAFINAHFLLSVFTKAIFIFIASFLFILSSSAQTTFDSIFNKLDPQKWSVAIEKKISRLEEKIIAKSQKTLNKLQHEEEKINKKLLITKDSAVAKAQLEEIHERYTSLQQNLKNPSSAVTAGNVKEYIPYLDTLQTVFKFLDQKGMTGNITQALLKIQSFSSRLQQANEIKKFVKERREQLQQQLQNLGLAKELKKFNKEVFYYAEQLKEYKEILNDPKKIERKAFDLLSKTKLFKDFMQKNSMLASLFRLPGDPNDPNYTASLAGLQTRAQVNTLIQNQIAAGGPNAQQVFQQNFQQAQSQLLQLKNKVIKSGGGSSDDIVPEGFKPNNQKTKNFWKRIELGTNVQSQRARNIFPVTSDIGLSLGYKLNDKSIIGIGTSYKMGWGSGWNNIRISHQGVGIRSFVDWKLKGSFWISGGFEQNYKAEIRSIDQLRNQSAWQQSGLLGISKVVSIKSKIFKKTKFQLLWDFLSYQQVPVGQPVVFRIWYNIK